MPARTTHPHLTSIAAPLLTILLSIPTLTHARIDTIVQTGDPAPDTTPGVTFNTVGLSGINASGQVAYFGNLTGTGITAMNDRGIWRDSTLMVRSGDPAPGTPADVVYDTTLGSAILNNAGQIVSPWSITGPGIGVGNDSGIWVDSTLAAREGDPAPGTPAGVVFSNLLAPVFNDAGQIAHRSFLTGTGVDSTNGEGLWRDNTLLARRSDPAPDTPAGVEFAGVSNNAVLNGLGQVAHKSTLQGTGVTASNDTGIWIDTTLIVREQDPAPDTSEGEILSSLSDPSINNAGQLTYHASLTGPTVDITNNEGIWLDSTLLVRKGNPAPGLPDDVVFTTLGDPIINGAGQVAHTSLLTGPGITTSNDQVIWRDSTIIAREGAPAPQTPDGVTFSVVLQSAINVPGHIAHIGLLTGPGVTTSNDLGIWIGDGTDHVLVVREGDTLAGKTVNSFSFPANTGGQDGRRSTFNDTAQLAYQANFTDGSSGIFIFTPDLHWRPTTSDNWDNPNHWSFNLTPSSPYDVYIDPTLSLTVTGPAADTAVNNLTIGGTNGTATLQLNGATIHATNPVTITPNGQLTGGGTIDADVDNHGTINADGATITGTLNNHGLATGNGFINASLNNTATGQVRVNAADHLKLTGASNTSDGDINIFSGTIEFDQALTVTPTGRINGRGLMLFNGGLTHQGTMNLSGGFTDIFGNVSITGPGQAITSGSGTTTFYDDFHHEGADVRAGLNAQVVFFGDVTGPGSYSGPGLIHYEAGFSPGSSPGTVDFGGNLTFGPSATLDTEVLATITAPVAGVDHDQLNIADTLTLNGTLNVIPFPDAGPITDTPLGNEYLAITYTTRTPDSFFHTITGTLINTAFAIAPLLDESTNEFTLRATIPGDLNLDNKVSVADLSTFALNFNTNPGLYNEATNTNSWQLGDFNTDGAITVADLSLLALNFGFDATDPTATPTPLSLETAATLAGIDPASIPEPTTATTILLAIIYHNTKRKYHHKLL